MAAQGVQGRSKAALVAVTALQNGTWGHDGAHMCPKVVTISPSTAQNDFKMELKMDPKRQWPTLTKHRQAW